MNRKFIFDSNYVLKSIFIKEENIDILKDFIESILNIKIKEIEQKKYLYDRYIFGNYLGIANVTIITNANIHLNIGIQIVDGLYIQNKIFLYYSQIYRSMIKTVTINILDCEYFNTVDYHKIIKAQELSNSKGNSKSYEKGELHVLELPKFQDTKIDTKEKAWINYLKYGILNKETKQEYEKIVKLDNSLNEYWKSERL